MNREAAKAQDLGRGRAGLLANLLLVGIGILGALAVGELALRLLGIHYPTGLLFQPDYYTGWSNRPGAQIPWVGEGLRSLVQFNREGLRDREHPKPKPVHTLRIAVLGDSFTEALEVPQVADFCSVMEAALRDCKSLAGRTPEVLNFGVQGYGTGQELITLERRVWQYAPDMIVLAYYPGNDLFDNSRLLQDFDSGETMGPRPFFSVQGNQLHVDNSFRGSERLSEVQSWYGGRTHYFFSHFRLWQLVQWYKGKGVLGKIHHLSLILRVHLGLLNNPLVGGQADEVWNEEARVARAVLNPPEDQRWKDAWRVTEGLITAMNHVVRDRDALFLVVVLSEPLQVYPSASRRQALLRQAGVHDPFYANHRLETLADAEGFEILSLGEPMQMYADKHQVFLHGFETTVPGFGHWNLTGHAVAGQLMADKVCATIAAKQRTKPHP